MIDLELFREYLEYSRQSNMYKNLNKTIGLEENKAQVNAIKDKLAKLMKEFKSSLTSDAKKKKLKTEIACWKLSNVFLSLIN